MADGEFNGDVKRYIQICSKQIFWKTTQFLYDICSILIVTQDCYLVSMQLGQKTDNQTKKEMQQRSTRNKKTNKYKRQTNKCKSKEANTTREEIAKKNKQTNQAS